MIQASPIRLQNGIFLTSEAARQSLRSEDGDGGDKPDKRWGVLAVWINQLNFLRFFSFCSRDETASIGLLESLSTMEEWLHLLFASECTVSAGLRSTNYAQPCLEYGARTCAAQQSVQKSVRMPRLWQCLPRRMTTACKKRCSVCHDPRSEHRGLHSKPVLIAIRL